MAFTKVLGAGIEPNQTIPNFDTTNINSSGIVTTSQLNVGTGVTVSAGVVTATTVDVSTVKVGTGVTISAGVVTATKFIGDGAELTGVAGLGTPLSNDPSSPLNVFYKTPEILTIGAGVSVTVESDDTSGNTVYTSLANVVVAAGGTFRIAAGTTAVFNALGVFR
tara:strand:+ start:56 stop:550 length:495 start_codon:yes stop_codon:yes gene_type:complete